MGWGTASPPGRAKAATSQSQVSCYSFFKKKKKSFLCFIIKTIGSVKLFLDCVFVFCSFDKS